MIVRDRPSGWLLFFVVRGSIVPKVGPQILAVMFIAAVVSYFHGVVFHHNLTFTAVPFTIVGLALSIFLGFRNSAAYDRYWEGRRLWGELLVTGRILARQVNSLITAGPTATEDDVVRLRRRMVYKTIAFAHALRHACGTPTPRRIWLLCSTKGISAVFSHQPIRRPRCCAAWAAICATAWSTS